MPMITVLWILIILLLLLQVLWIRLVQRAQAATAISIAQAQHALKLVDEWQAVAAEWERTANDALRELK